MKKSEELCLFDAFSFARDAKEDYEWLNDSKEDELSERKKEYEICMNLVSEAYDRFVNSIPCTPEFEDVKTCLSKKEVKNLFIKAMIE